MEFQNIYMEKSWKIFSALRTFHPILTHCLGYYGCYNFIMSVVCGCKEMQGDHIKAQQCVLSMLKLVIVVACQSWKNHARVMENHGKIMEFDSGKALGTLIVLACNWGVRRDHGVTQYPLQC